MTKRKTKTKKTKIKRHVNTRRTLRAIDRNERGKRGKIINMATIRAEGVIPAPGNCWEAFKKLRL